METWLVTKNTNIPIYLDNKAKDIKTLQMKTEMTVLTDKYSVSYIDLYI